MADEKANQANQIKYVKPKAMRLSSARQGSYAAFAGGQTANGNCNHTGGTATGGNCKSGTQATYTCNNGTSA